MSEAMELTERNFEQIGSYVREHLGTWVRELWPPTTQRTDPLLLERIVRVEEELKSQRDLMKQGFDHIDKRFEQIDKRFEETRLDMNARLAETRADVNARFDAARSHTNHWMLFMTIVLGALGAAMTLATILVR